MGRIIEQGEEGGSWRGGLLPLIIKAVCFVCEHPAGPSSPLTQGLDPGLSLTLSFQMLTRREGSHPVFPLWVAGATCLMGKLFASFRLRSPHHDFSKSVMNECMILELEVGVVLEGWEVRGPQLGQVGAGLSLGLPGSPLQSRDRSLPAAVPRSLWWPQGFVWLQQGGAALSLEASGQGTLLWGTERKSGCG